MTEGEASDQDLLDAVRRGSRTAFAVLWRRHSKAALTVARSYSSLDPDDIVSEAFANIFTTIQNGAGPVGSFRAYLFTTVRNVAAAQGVKTRTVNLDEVESLTTGFSTEDDALESLDRDSAARAFAALPARWQEVLWYTEVEGMAPRHAAEFLGMKPNAVAALALRAREGLRQAWIGSLLVARAHDPECARTIERLPAYVRRSITGRTAEPVRRHLETCEACQEIAGEVRSISSSLALTLLPLVLGAGAAAYLESLPHAAGAASVASSAGIAAMPLRGGRSLSGRAGTISLVSAGVLVVAGAGLATALMMGGPAGSPDTSSAVDAGPAPVAPASPTSPPATTTPEPAPPGTPSPAPPRPAPEPETAVPGGPPSSADAPPEPAPSAEPPASTAPSPAPTPPTPPPTPPVHSAPPITEPPPPSEEPSDAPPASPGLAVVDGPTTVYPSIIGQAGPGTEISVSATPIAEAGTDPGQRDRPEWDVVADDDGHWSLVLDDLPPGRFTVIAVHLAPDGRGLIQSTAVVVTLADPPTLRLTELGSGLGVRLDVTGIPGATVRLYEGLWATPPLLLDDSGSWAVNLPIGLPASGLVVRYIDGDRVGAPGYPAGR